MNGDNNQMDQNQYNETNSSVNNILTNPTIDPVQESIQSVERNTLEPGTLFQREAAPEPVQSIGESIQNVQPTQELVQPAKPASNQLKKGISAGKIIIICISCFIFWGLIIYLIFTNFGSKQGFNPISNTNPIVELVQFDSNQVVEKNNIVEEGKTYFKVLTYKNNNLVVDFKFYTEAAGQDTDVKMDLFIQGYKNKTVRISTYYYCENQESVECKNGGATLEDIESETLESVKNHIGTIKGDKYYFYIIEFWDDDATFIFINEKGNILNNSIKAYNKYHGTQELILTEGCSSFQFADVNSNNERHGNFIIAENTIYYFDYNSDGNCASENSTLANEYKIIIEKDTVSTSKSASCHVSLSNGRC